MSASLGSYWRGERSCTGGPCTAPKLSCGDKASTDHRPLRTTFIADFTKPFAGVFRGSAFAKTAVVRRRAAARGQARAIAALQTCKLHRWVPLGKGWSSVAFGRHRRGGCVALLPAVCLLRSGKARAASSGLACGRLQGVGPRFLGLLGTPPDGPARHVPPGPVGARLRAAARRKRRSAQTCSCAFAPREGPRGRRRHGLPGHVGAP